MRCFRAESELTLCALVLSLKALHDKVMQLSMFVSNDLRVIKF